MRKLIVLGLIASFLAVAAVATVMSAGGKVPGQNGRIAFALFDPARDGTVTYTANPDGSRVKRLFAAGPSGEPRWSPDGSRLTILAACTDGQENCAAVIVNPDTGPFVSSRCLIPPSSPAAFSGRRTANGSRVRGSANGTPAETASTRFAHPTAAV
jgi:hypothetical protein